MSLLKTNMNSRSKRAKIPKNYNEKTKNTGSAPAWVKEVETTSPRDSQRSNAGKENEGKATEKAQAKQKIKTADAETKKVSPAYLFAALHSAL